MLSRKQTLSPRDLARAVGMSESSLKRWADEGLLQITRTTGGHRRIAIAEAASYIRRSGRKLCDSTPLGLNPLAEADHSPVAADRLDPLLVRAILSGQAAAASGLAVRMYLSGRSVCEICDGPLTHALRQVESDSSGVESPAALAVVAALKQLAEILAESAHRCCVVLPRRPTDVATNMAEVVLLAEQWKRVLVDSSTPDSLINAAGEHHAALVCISDMDDIPSLRRLAETLRASDCKLVVVGKSAAQLQSTTNLYTVFSMSELASLARCMDAGPTLSH